MRGLASLLSVCGKETVNLVGPRRLEALDPTAACRDDFVTLCFPPPRVARTMRHTPVTYDMTHIIKAATPSLPFCDLETRGDAAAHMDLDGVQ